MMNRRFSLALVAGMFLFGCAADGIAYIQLEWKIASFSVKPQPAVSGRVTVECAWTAKVTGDWKFEYQEVVLISTIFVWDVATNGAVDYHEWAYEHTLWPPTGKEYRPGVTSDFDGARVHTANLSAGLHKASCQLDGSGGEDYYTTFRRSRST